MFPVPFSVKDMEAAMKARAGLEFKTLPGSMEFKAAQDGNGMLFQGYASTWDIDLGGDVIVRGAFSKTIAERGPQVGADGRIRSKIKVLSQHMPWWPIGLPTKMAEDDIGLFVEGRISDTAMGRDMMTLINDLVVDKMSIGYLVIKSNYNSETDVRQLTEIKLYEFSPVTFPMNEAADIHSAKQDSDRLARLLDALKEMKTVDDFFRLQEILKKGSNAGIHSILSALAEKAAEHSEPPVAPEEAKGTEEPQA